MDRDRIRRPFTGDAWTDVKLLQAEERAAAARDATARRVPGRDSRPSRRRARAWLGSVLLAAGRRLVGPAPGVASAPGERP
jgi:hypothetical protein